MSGVSQQGQRSGPPAAEGFNQCEQENDGNGKRENTMSVMWAVPVCAMSVVMMAVIRVHGVSGSWLITCLLQTPEFVDQNIRRSADPLSECFPLLVFNLINIMSGFCRQQKIIARHNFIE